MKVSVIITTYNGRRYLADAISSALDQREVNLEIIVVDDGSVDDCADIVKSFAGVRYIKKVNGGVASARNLGIMEASHDLIALLDHDDRFLPLKLAHQAKVFQENPKAVLCHTDVRLIDGAGELIKNDHLSHRGGRIPPSGRIFLDLFRGNFIFCCTTMFRKSAVVNNGMFNHELWGVDDYSMWMRLALDGDVVHIPSILAEYRWHGENASSNYQRMAYGKVKACGLILNHLKQKSTRDEIASCRAIFTQRVIDEAWAAWHQRSDREARDLIRLGLTFSQFDTRLWRLFARTFFDMSQTTRLTSKEVE